MSRIITGISILLSLLAVCCLCSLLLPKVHLDISRQLEQAAMFAQQENWQQASRFADQAAQAWKQAHNLTTVAADHELTDEIDALFAELEIYASQREIPDFAATALHLSRLTAAIGQSQGFSLSNLI